MPRYNYKYGIGVDDVYCYPNSTVLKNLYNIRDEEKLADIENKITSVKLLNLKSKPIVGNFDLEHLKSIHRYIFEEIYSWAGTTRQGDFLAKGSSVFCRGQFIDSMACDIAKALKDENHLRGLSKERFISRLAYYMGEINALHPFREGNGRTQKEFFRLLSQQAGYELAFAKTTKQKLLQADISTFNGDYEPLKQVLRELISEI